MNRPRPRTDVALALHFNPEGDLLAAARECEAEIFQRWYGNTRAEIDEEYGPYEPDSAFIVLCDDTDVVGVSRMIRPGPMGLKTWADVARPPWEVAPDRVMAAAGLEAESTWDVATIGVRSGRGLAGRQCAAALYHGIVLTGRANRVHTMVAILDEKVRGMMASAGLSVQALPGTGPMPYLGSAASTPVFGGMSAVLGQQRRLSPDAYRLVTLGVGLNDVSVPSGETFVFPVRCPSVAPIPGPVPLQRVIDLTDPKESADRLVQEAVSLR